MSQNQRFYVGTYTEPILFGTGDILEGKGEGIYTVELDREEKKLTVTGVSSKIKNPSFVAMSQDARLVYAVNELKEFDGELCGSISSFRVKNKEGDLEFCDRKPTHGQDPCHVAVSEHGDAVIVSNFMSGSVCVYQADKDGSLLETDFRQHDGSGAHPIRQSGPHAHSCIKIVGTGKVMIPDLGMDKLMVYQLQEDGTLVLCRDEIYVCQPGSGPRYGEFHPKLDVLYIINELSSSLSILKYDCDHGNLQCLQEISTLPEKCDNTCADLHVTMDGRFVFASNRGHDSITAYMVNADGTLKWLYNVPCGGKTPRNFCIDPLDRFLLVGNQDSDDIVMFEINEYTGELDEVFRVGVPTPVCICPVI